MNKRIFLSTVLFAAALAAQTGQMNVTVADPAGAGVAGASVTISSRPLYDPAHPQNVPSGQNFSVKSGASGIATFRSVPAGAYAICAYPAGGPLVDTCSWALNQPSVYLASGKVASTSAGLKRGATLTVIVNDPLQLLASTSVSNQASVRRQLRLGVSIYKGHWQPLRLDKNLSTGRQYSLIVPADVDLKLIVGSFGYKVAVPNGNNIKANDPAAFVPVHVSSSTGGQTVQINLVSIL